MGTATPLTITAVTVDQVQHANQPPPTATVFHGNHTFADISANLATTVPTTVPGSFSNNQDEFQDGGIRYYVRRHLFASMQSMDHQSWEDLQERREETGDVTLVCVEYTSDLVNSSFTVTPRNAYVPVKAHRHVLSNSSQFFQRCFQVMTLT